MVSKTGAIAVALGLLVTATVGCSHDLHVRVDHTTTRAAKPLADAGPPAGSYRRLWQIPVPHADYQTSYQLIGGHIVVVTSTGIDTYDVQTGKPGWHYREPGRQLIGFATAAGVLVIRSSAGDSELSDVHMVGIDTATGSLLWDTTKNWFFSHDGNFDEDPGRQHVSRPGDAAGGVVFVGSDEGERLGIDARTGKKRWKTTRSDVANGDCTPKPADNVADDRRALGSVVFPCKNGRAVTAALDPDNGAVAWSRASSSGNATAVTSGAVTLYQDRSVQLVGPDGRTIRTAPDACAVECKVFATGGKVVLAAITNQARTFTVVDPRGGPTTTFTDTTIGTRGDELGYAAAGGRVYVGSDVLAGLPELAPAPRLLPAGLSVLDVAGGRLEHAPLPEPATGLRSYESKSDATSWLGAADRHLFLAAPRADTSRVILTAYGIERTAQPTELGGISPNQWPNACQLLRGIPTGGLAVRLWPGDPVLIGDVRIREASCVAPVSSTAVAVLWVAASEREAADLFVGGRPSTVGADEEGTELGSTILRVGRVIIAVATDDRHPAVVLKTVVQNLRRRTS